MLIMYMPFAEGNLVLLHSPVPVIRMVCKHFLLRWRVRYLIFKLFIHCLWSPQLCRTPTHVYIVYHGAGQLPHYVIYTACMHMRRYARKSNEVEMSEDQAVPAEQPTRSSQSENQASKHPRAEASGFLYFPPYLLPSYVNRIIIILLQ